MITNYLGLGNEISVWSHVFHKAVTNAVVSEVASMDKLSVSSPRHSESAGKRPIILRLVSDVEISFFLPISDQGAVVQPFISLRSQISFSDLITQHL